MGRSAAARVATMTATRRVLRWWPAVLIVALAGWMLLLAPASDARLRPVTEIVVLHHRMAAFYHSPADPAWPAAWSWYGVIPAVVLAGAAVVLAGPMARRLGAAGGRPALATVGCWFIAAGIVGNVAGAIVSALAGPVPPGTAVDPWTLPIIGTSNPADAALYAGVLLCAAAALCRWWRPVVAGMSATLLAVGVVAAVTALRSIEIVGWAAPLVDRWHP